LGGSEGDGGAGQWKARRPAGNRSQVEQRRSQDRKGAVESGREQRRRRQRVWVRRY